MQIGDFVTRKHGKRIGCVAAVRENNIQVEWRNFNRPCERQWLLNIQLKTVPLDRITGINTPVFQVGQKIAMLPEELAGAFKEGTVKVTARFYSFKHNKWAYRIEDVEKTNAWIAEDLLCPI